MKITVGQLKKLIRESLVKEWGSRRKRGESMYRSDDFDPYSAESTLGYSLAVKDYDAEDGLPVEDELGPEKQERPRLTPDEKRIERNIKLADRGPRKGRL